MTNSPKILWLQEVEKDYLKSDLPDLHPGDTVRVRIRITEGNKERLQAYEGVIIGVRGSGLGKTVTVRRVFQGVGIERVFLVHSPKVESITVLRLGNVRRAKLYYLRNLVGKAARIKEKTMLIGKTTKGGMAQTPAETAAKAEQPAPVEATVKPTAAETQPAPQVEETAPTTSAEASAIGEEGPAKPVDELQSSSTPDGELSDP